MADVDYKIHKNDESGILHLAIGYDTITVCGINMTKCTNIIPSNMTMRAFWRKPKRCKNCEKAAKR